MSRFAHTQLARIFFHLDSLCPGALGKLARMNNTRNETHGYSRSEVQCTGTRICLCCGETMTRRSLALSRNPNVCACCSSLVDGMPDYSGHRAWQVRRWPISSNVKLPRKRA